MYITHPTQGAGARPSKPQTRTATRLATPNAHQCVHQPREGRGRNRQTPPKKNGGGGTRDRHTAAKPRTHSTGGGQTPQPDSTEGGTHGAPRKHIRGPPCQSGRHPDESSDRAEDRTPLTRRNTPQWRGDGQKKTHRRSPSERGRGDRDQETQDHDRQRRTPQSHDTTGRKTTALPRSAKKKQKGRGGGQTSPTATHAHPQTTDSPTRKWRETNATHARGRAPQHPNQNKAGGRQNPNSHTHTPRRQEWWGTRGARTEAHIHSDTPARTGGAQPEPEHKHTHPHHRPRPGVAWYKRRTHRHTHTPTPQLGTAGRSHRPSPRTPTHSAHPSQEPRGTDGACTQTRTPPNTPARSGGRSRNTSLTHTPTPHAPAKSGGVQAERTHSHARPKAQPGMAGCKPKRKPNGTHHKPQLGTEGRSQNPYQSTPTQDPSQSRRGYRKTQTQAQAPHNSRKPSVHSPGTEAARAMQVTRRNEIRTPGARLHPKASAALGLEAERATPKHLGTPVPSTCISCLGNGIRQEVR